MIKLYKNFYALKIFPGVHIIRVNGAYALVQGTRNVKKFLDVYVLSDWNSNDNEGDTDEDF